MSDFRAIAAVTATLRHILDSAISQDVPGTKVTTKRPEDLENAPSEPAVNIYLYQVTPNASYRNADLPTRDARSQVVTRPQAALDLHYLLTFFGDDGELEPQRLLGSVARTLHTHPVLTRKDIQLAKAAITSLVDADLDEQVELVKFSPMVLNLEELSKLWSVFFQTAYRLSTAYQASVVLLDAKELPRVPLPVQRRNIVVLPFRSPVITRILSSGGEDVPILADSSIVIEGRELHSDDTRVRIAGELVEPQEVTNTRLVLPLAPLADRMLAGVQGVQVVHKIFSGPPPYGFESNVAAFILRPSFSSNDLQLDAAAGTITVGNVSPQVAPDQRALLLLNQIVVPTNEQPKAYTLPALKRTSINDPLEFSIQNITAGSYFVRIQIDGAESALQRDSQGRFIGPFITIGGTGLFSLTTEINPTGSGDIIRHPNAAFFEDGTAVQLTAVPSAGYRFLEWTGDVGSANSSANTIQVVMDSNRTITAKFAIEST